MWKDVNLELPRKSGTYLVCYSDYAVTEFDRKRIEIRYFSLKHNKFNVGYVEKWCEIPPL